LNFEENLKAFDAHLRRREVVNIVLPISIGMSVGQSVDRLNGFRALSGKLHITWLSYFTCSLAFGEDKTPIGFGFTRSTVEVTRVFFVK